MIGQVIHGARIRRCSWRASVRRRLLRGSSKYGLEPVTVEADGPLQGHAPICEDPAGFVEAVMAE